MSIGKDSIISVYIGDHKTPVFRGARLLYAGKESITIEIGGLEACINIRHVLFMVEEAPPTERGSNVTPLQPRAH